jgi:hypothetical protein
VSRIVAGISYDYDLNAIESGDNGKVQMTNGAIEPKIIIVGDEVFFTHERMLQKYDRYGEVENCWSIAPGLSATRGHQTECSEDYW